MRVEGVNLLCADVSGENRDVVRSAKPEQPRHPTDTGTNFTDYRYTGLGPVTQPGWSQIPGRRLAGTFRRSLSSNPYIRGSCFYHALRRQILPRERSRVQDGDSCRARPHLSSPPLWMRFAGILAAWRRSRNSSFAAKTRGPPHSGRCEGRNRRDKMQESQFFQGPGSQRQDSLEFRIGLSARIAVAA
jgi:hypothetical protein